MRSSTKYNEICLFCRLTLFNFRKNFNLQKCFSTSLVLKAQNKVNKVILKIVKIQSSIQFLRFIIRQQNYFKKIQIIYSFQYPNIMSMIFLHKNSKFEMLSVNIQRKYTKYNFFVSFYLSYRLYGGRRRENCYY